jgi:putative transposase
LCKQPSIPKQKSPARSARRSPKLLDYYRNAFEAPEIGMTAAYATGDYTMQQIADAFGVHYATVSRAVNTRVRS